MKSLKIFAAAMALVFTLSLTSAEACDKNKTKASKECSGKKTEQVKSAKNENTNKAEKSTEVAKKEEEAPSK